MLQRFFNKLRYIHRRLFRAVEMSMSSVTEKRDATVGIHHAESQGGADTGLPPLKLSLHHESGNAVNVPVAPPLDIRRSITCQIGAWRVAMERDDAQLSFRIPCRKVLRKGGLGYHILILYLIKTDRSIQLKQTGAFS